MEDSIHIAEHARRTINHAIHSEKLSEIGQFLTPVSIAKFMASLFEKNVENARILDAGAGGGILLASLVKSLCFRSFKPKTIEIVAVENDKHVLQYLNNTIDSCRFECEQNEIGFRATVLNEDFISASLLQLDDGLFAPQKKRFTHAILNPPYKKINSNSKTRKLLSTAGMETTNLYAAFVWLAIKLLEPHGEIVAITPRSFCNGPYFLNFRKDILDLTSLTCSSFSF